MKNTMSSVIEVEVGVLFNNAKEAARIRLTDHNISHSKNATTIQVDK